MSLPTESGPPQESTAEAQAGDVAAWLRCADALLQALPPASDEAPGAAGSALLGRFSDADLQRLMTAASRAYLHRATGDGVAFAPFLPAAGVTATEAMLLATAILKAVDVALFELGMWQAWSGRH